MSELRKKLDDLNQYYNGIVKIKNDGKTVILSDEDGLKMVAALSEETLVPGFSLKIPLINTGVSISPTIKREWKITAFPPYNLYRENIPFEEIQSPEAIAKQLTDHAVSVDLERFLERN